jgi:hypothetical protein
MQLILIFPLTNFYDVIMCLHDVVLKSLQSGERLYLIKPAFLDKILSIRVTLRSTSSVLIS